MNGDSHPRGKTTVNVTAIGLSRAEQIFYRAQTTYLTPSSNFHAGRNATGQAAQDLYGATYRDPIYSAWCAVGVGASQQRERTALNTSLRASPRPWRRGKRHRSP